jgi:hypothetical protein
VNPRPGFDGLADIETDKEGNSDRGHPQAQSPQIGSAKALTDVNRLASKLPDIKIEMTDIGLDDPSIYRHARPSSIALKHGKKHHAFSTQSAPYPLNYETRILD